MSDNNLAALNRVKQLEPRLDRLEHQVGERTGRLEKFAASVALNELRAAEMEAAAALAIVDGDDPAMTRLLGRVLRAIEALEATK